MPAFLPKKITYTESLGEKLRQARRYKNLKAEDIAKKINIRVEYLLALEDNHLDLLPSGLYGKNFVKEYASFLGLDIYSVLNDWDSQTQSNLPNNPFHRKILARRKFIIFPKIVRNIIIFCAISICFIYLLFYFKKITLAPLLIVSRPITNLSIKSNNITISGQTEPEAEVKINGEIVLNNRNGYFSQEINLKKGLNTLTIKAKKKYSREQIITRQILVE